jgi:hypothetical protein
MKKDKNDKGIKVVILFLFFCFSNINGQTQKTFALPEIKTFNYISVPSALERIFPPNSCQDGLIKALKSYDIKLKNIKQYEVYLVKKSCEFSQSTCLCFETSAQGDFNFFVLYNRKSKQAKVLLASYEFLSDSEVYNMSFKIKNDEIRLTDSGMTEGENGKAEEFSKNTIKVYILKNGEIKVKSGREK